MEQRDFGWPRKRLCDFVGAAASQWFLEVYEASVERPIRIRQSLMREPESGLEAPVRRAHSGLAYRRLRLYDQRTLAGKSRASFGTGPDDQPTSVQVAADRNRGM
jgi:hypothetical protein